MFYWHVSLMPGWEPVVGEQLAMMQHSGITHVRSFVIADYRRELDQVTRAAKRLGIDIEVLGASVDFSLGEGPTIRAIHKWSQDNPQASVCYFHTKGISDPNCPHKRHWRRAMMRHQVWEHDHNLSKLCVDDLVGCAWQPLPDYPHFCGNFWAARCDWLANLPHPDDYRFSRPDFQWAGTPHSWQKRIYVETWVGSRPWHSVHDRIAIGYPLWSAGVYDVSTDVPGFSYERDFTQILAGESNVRQALEA